MQSCCSKYDVLFQHWRKTNVARDIRERLQFVGAMVPDPSDRPNYLSDLCEKTWDLFRKHLYDELSPDEMEGFSFDESDENAPHFPWPIRWHKSFASVRSLHKQFVDVDHRQIDAIFGHFLDGIKQLILP